MPDNSASRFVKKAAGSAGEPVSNSSDGSTQEKGLRLQVFLAHGGVASRRACEELIAAGRITVNGQVVTVPGTKVFPVDQVLFDVKPVVA